MSEVVVTQKVCASKVGQSIKAWLTDDPSFSGPSMKNNDFAFVFPRLGNPHYLIDDKYYPGIVVVFEERHRANRRQAAAYLTSGVPLVR